jgi:hypothetical protein
MAVGESFQKLKRNHEWHSKSQLRGALGYDELYPEEIHERLVREEVWTPERVRRELPFATSRSRRP